MAVNTTTVYANKVRDMYNSVIENVFRPQVVFKQLTQDKMHRVGVDSARGDKVDFYINDLLNPSTSALSETTDPASKSLSDSIVQVEVKEYGDVVQTTKKLDLTTFNDTGIEVVEQVGFAAAESVDLIVRAALDAQTSTDYVTYADGGTTKLGLTTGDILTGALVRRAAGALRGRNVKSKFNDGSYLAIVHPDVFEDLFKDTASAGFNEIGRYAIPKEIFSNLTSGTTSGQALNGEMGKYANFRIMTSTLCPQEWYAGTLAQAATTVDGAHAAGATVISLTSATGITAGDVLNITDGTDWYSYVVQSVATNDVTIDKPFNKNGNAYRAATGSGIPTALSGGEAAKETTGPVYTSYFAGWQSVAYAETVAPTVQSYVPQTGMRRLTSTYWYTLMGVGALRNAALHKIYSFATNPTK